MHRIFMGENFEWLINNITSNAYELLFLRPLVPHAQSLKQLYWIGWVSHNLLYIQV